MTAGVYAIFNLNNGFVYVGSSVNIERRWNGRVWEFNRGQSSNKRLQDDWLKTLGQGFEFRILEVTGTDNKALLQAEDQWMTCLRAVSPGLYNVRKASVGRHGFSMVRRGWSWPYHWDGSSRVRSRKAHYFTDRGKSSLCEKELKVSAHGFEDDNHGSPDNCAACQKAYALLPKRRRPPWSAK
jgi:group I intron endonuclease